MKKLYKKVLKAIKQYENIVVIRHDVPDFDASGSQFGLATWIKDNYPSKKVYAVGKPHKYFSPSLYPTTDSFDAENEKFLLIIVDCANQPRIDGKELIAKADYVIKIDHHPLCDHYGDIVIVDEHAAAAAELVAEMLISFKKKITKECAYYLYSAIVGDSGRFQYSDTNPRTFNVVSKLLESKFDFQDVYNKMYIKSIEDIKIINFIYDNYKLTDKGVAYYSVTVEQLKQLGIEREKIKAFVNLFAGYEEVKVWVQFSEDETATDEYKWRVSIRSRGIKINGVAALHNGGGHDNAAGAKTVSEEENAQIVKELDELL